MENEQFLENRQNYMIDNSIQQLNIASAGDGVGAEVLSGVAGEILGGKYDEHHEEHDVGDDDELKYVEEVQQSEKQQQQLQMLKNCGLEDDGSYECNELAEKETSNNDPHEFGNGNGGFVFGGDHEQQQREMFNVGNGHGTNGHVNTNDDFGNIISTGFEEKFNMVESDLDGFKNEGDISSTLNVAESADAYIPQIDVKIETKVEHIDMVDEEEPSSMATNTTNGTSSLSENAPNPEVVVPKANAVDVYNINLENKENSELPTLKRPNELDLEQAHSHLNPDAKEFIPSFGSNPTSPTSPFASGIQQNDPVLSDIMETQMYFGQAPSVIPNHILDDGDTILAGSPRKERGDNIDTVPLPRELAEFEKEADKRPHELEPEVIDGFHQMDGIMTPDQAMQQLPLDDITTYDKENQPPSDSDGFRSSNFIDHGPETWVDHEDFDLQVSSVLSSVQARDDVMRRSMYVASEDAIEDVLNSVQPIPTGDVDSINNSFIEESAAESAVNQLAGGKELLQVEEKEHVSHSPSTEEIQMNLQNTFNSSNKDIPQLPIDMHSTINMQESMYVESEQHRQGNDEQSEECKVEKSPDQDYICEDQQPDQAESQLYFENQDLFEEQNPPEQENQQEIHEFQEEFSSETKEDLETIVGEQLITQPEETPVEPLLPEDLELGSNEIHHDHITLDPVEGTIPVQVTEESLVTNASNSFIVNDSLSEQMEIQEKQEEPFSPTQFDDVSNTYASELHFTDTPPANQQDITNVNVATDEKHFPDEINEQKLLSVSDLEQQMSEMILNNADGDISQAEELASTVAKAAIEDLSENVITPAEVIDQEEKHEHHNEQEHFIEQMYVDDSFSLHEQECLQDFQKELQREQEKSVPEPVESPVEQHKQQQLENEIVAFEEPIITEAKDVESSFTNKETEIENVIKSEEISLITELTPVEQNETEILKSPEQLPEQVTEATEIVKDETSKEPELEELKEKEEEEAVKERVIAAPEITADLPVESVIVAATAVVASAAAAVATKDAPSKDKDETSKKPLAKSTIALTKPKVAATTAAKKTAEVAKKPVGLAARPRTAPAKTSGTTTEKKPIGKTTTTTATTAARKPVLSSATATKVIAKTTSTTSTTRTVTTATKTATTKPTTAPRTVPSTSTVARKPAAANGSMAKPRPEKAPAKPTTLGLPGSNGAPKTKPVSPRATLTSNVRKTTLATTAAKSPIKPTTTSDVSKTASSTLASRTKTTATTVSSTASKTFTARPAPKFTSSSSTTTTTTATAKRSAMSSTTTTVTKSINSPLRKSTPTKPTSGKTTTAGALKSKTTPVTKAASPAAKPAPIRKPVAAIINGEANDNKELNGPAADKQNYQASIQNGDFKAVKLEEQQNCDSSIPMQTETQEQSFLETKNEQIPMDLTNA